jgi:hypothetical protein
VRTATFKALLKISTAEPAATRGGAFFEPVRTLWYG